jgi:hypothetical protein
MEPVSPQGGSPLRADGQPDSISTRRAGRRLAARLLDPAREVPIVVVAGRDVGAPCLLAVDSLAAELVDEAAVVVLATDDAARGLFAGLPRGACVLAGQARTFPADEHWHRDPVAAPVRQAWHPSLARQTQRQVAVDAFVARRAAPRVPATPGDVATRAATVVAWHGEHRARVRCEDGTPAVLLVDAVAAGLPRSDCLRHGQHVVGHLKPGSGSMPSFVPTAPSAGSMVYGAPGRGGTGQRRRHVEPGDLLRGVVRSVGIGASPGAVSVYWHPAVVGSVRLPHHTAVRPEDLVAPGDVVLVHVESWDPPTGVLVSQAGRESPATDALSVLPGGPPWLPVDAVGVADTWRPPQGPPVVADGEATHSVVDAVTTTVPDLDAVPAEVRQLLAPQGPKDLAQEPLSGLPNEADFDLAQLTYLRSELAHQSIEQVAATAAERWRRHRLREAGLPGRDPFPPWGASD